MLELQMFKNEEFGEIRVIEIEGKTWFIGKDVAVALGYSNASKAVSTHCKHIRKEMLSHSQNGNMVKTQTALINEGDLYRLIMKSKLPSAEKFESWVMDEVLPQIRQTGGYIPLSEEDDDATIMAKALLVAQKTLDKKNELIKNLQPKADWFDTFINSEGTYSSTQVAKLFKISSAQKLNKMLNEKKIIYKKGTNWYTYSDVDKSWYKLIAGSNNEHTYSQLKFTPKGVYEISKILNIEFEEEDLNNIK